jgi:DNA (cytosine-5)-methyltransferase 1
MVLQPVAHTLRGEGFDASEDGTGRGIPLVPDIAPTLDQRAGRSGENSFATSGGLVPVGTDLYNGAMTGDIAATMGTNGSSINGSGPTVLQPLATDIKQVQWASGGGQVENDTAQALRSNAEYNYQFARVAMRVRRLMPVECERLQGFPDGWTDVPWRGKPTSPDGPRYKALGNSMAVNCMRWIGERIQQVEDIHGD